MPRYQFSRKDCQKGGKTRMANLTPEERSALGQKGYEQCLALHPELWYWLKNNIKTYNGANPSKNHKTLQ